MDITKCPGTGCPMRDTCRRYTATSGERQSWFSQVPLYQLDGGELKCDEHWKVGVRGDGQE